MINNEKDSNNPKITLKKQETMHNGINIDDDVDDDNIITLIDGKRLTGIKLHLPLSSLNPVIAYYGVRYASLGVQHNNDKDQLSRMATTTNHSDSFKFNNNHDIMKVPALHRFSHSVASFFYESPIGVYSHSILPPVCPQPSMHVHLEDKDIPKQVKDRLIHLLPFLRNQDEDYKTRKSYKRPIFLFVHGESYEYGSGNAYDLSVLASYSDTVGITLNYRLGLLGFLFTNNHGISGNYALYDLHAAIMWIKTNIESFNGNSNEITLIGYGHGAALVHLFSLSKMSQETLSIETSLFMNTDLLIGWTEAPASNLYYSHSNIHKMPYSLLIQKLVYEMYPYNQDVIKEIIEYAYCNSDIFHFNNNNNNDDYIGNSEKQFKEVDCRWKVLDILSDGLYTVPIIQTLKMHSDFYTSQRMINRMQNPSLSSSLPTLLFPTGTPTITRLKEQINNYDKHRKSTYALFFNYKTSQQITKHRNATRKQLQMGKIGFADDLPYLLGAPFISPNQLEPFSNEYTDMDKKISVNLMNYLANFIHNGIPKVDQRCPFRNSPEICGK
ncbi:neuroligin 3 (S09 family) [Schistosoma mansoni]|uniref:neuroligin 3 (S09 family) n=1 Tax=Schistosoma mansoni TaxID=6183 RepID=UPI0001A624FA|nr:neuroligin 3 (S09 family) [Schistosoma mansoni]|eukprot:XP_018650137.1 neuroligin 3 (S09 family) [Schistosoma mansoni]